MKLPSDEMYCPKCRAILVFENEWHRFGGIYKCLVCNKYFYEDKNGNLIECYPAVSIEGSQY